MGFPRLNSLNLNYWQSTLLIFIVFRSTLMYSVILFIAYFFLIPSGRYCFPFFRSFYEFEDCYIFASHFSVIELCHLNWSFARVCKNACKMTESLQSHSVSDFCFHWRWLTYSHPQGCEFLIWSAVYLISCLLLLKDQCFSHHHGRETDWHKPTLFHPSDCTTCFSKGELHVASSLKTETADT